MVENVYNNTSAEKEAYQTEGRKAPKNVRQVGYFTGNFRVYIEDYVCTFTRWLAEQDYAGRCIAVLVGEFAKTEHTRDVYAYGCVVMENVETENQLEITGEHWSYIYENIKEYFPDGEIVGWFYGGTSFTEQEKEMLKQVHLDHFAGVDRILMLYDFLEKEEELYRYEEGELAKQSGYYIYYEKNEEMQNYMIDKKQGRNRIEEVDDKVVRQVRARFAPQKREEMEASVTVETETKSAKRGGERFLYTMGIAAAAVAVVFGAAAVQNGERLASFEQTLNQMLNESGDEAKDKNSEKLAQDDTSGGNIFTEPLYQETFGRDNAEEGNIPSGKSDEREDMEQSPQVSGEPHDMENQPEISDEPDSGKIVAGEDGSDGKGAEKNGSDEKQGASYTEEQNEEKPDAGAEEGIADENMSSTSSENNSESEIAGNNEVGEERLSAEETSTDTWLDTSNYQYYIVQPGDTLAGICKKLYGNTKHMQHIKELNQITDENVIYADQELLVP